MTILIAVLFALLRLLGFALADGFTAVADAVGDIPDVVIVAPGPSDPPPPPAVTGPCSGHPGRGLPAWCR